TTGSAGTCRRTTRHSGRRHTTRRRETRRARPLGAGHVGAGSAGSQGEAVCGEDLVDGLVVRGAAEPAVAGAAGGHALGLAAGDERAARVARLGAGAGAGQAGDGALRVADG